MNQKNRDLVDKFLPVVQPQTNFAIRWANLQKYLGADHPCALSSSEVVLLGDGIRRLAEEVRTNTLSRACWRCGRKTIGRIEETFQDKAGSWVVWTCCGSRGMLVADWFDPDRTGEPKPEKESGDSRKAKRTNARGGAA